MSIESPKAIPPALDMTLDTALKDNPALKALEQQDPQVAELITVAKRLEGSPGTRRCMPPGWSFAPKAITEYAPIYKSQKDEITTQWAMKEIERIGLLKMDFLGLSTLTLLHDAVARIRDTTAKPSRWTCCRWRMRKPTSSSATGGRSGSSSSRARACETPCARAKPERFGDLIALNALNRPGPLRGGVIDDFIARKHGKVEVKYELPALEPILKETYGVIAFQEQVMRMGTDLAGFSMGDADLLRKAMGKKSAEVMQAQRQQFVQGAIARGVPRKKATKIFDLMEFFAGYGFNKSHSTAYALIAYQTAYLKANYPWQFMASLLTIEAQNTDKLALYMGECRDMGVPILPPDINASDLAFKVGPDGVRFGLTAVKNVGEGAIASILAGREHTGRIGSLFTLCEDIDLRLVNKRVLESLIKAGAFDSCLAEWVTTTGHAPRAARRRGGPGAGARRAASTRPGARTGHSCSSRWVPPTAPVTTWRCPMWPRGPNRSNSPMRRKRSGCTLSGHPIDGYRDQLEAAGARAITLLATSQPKVVVGGIISAYRPLKTRRGAPMAVLTIEDRDGSLEVVVFPKTYERCAPVLAPDRLVLVTGKLDKDDDTARLMADEVRPIETLSGRVGGADAVDPPYLGAARPADAAGLGGAVSGASRTQPYSAAARPDRTHAAAAGPRSPEGGPRPPVRASSPSRRADLR